ncbi:MAG: 1-(5-phosphoribosyl)-5-amino-4-imidazole-carboxylate carboxylase [Anaerosolibacter sp.]|jgi:NCAIR mutase (PurE)-related protein|uniref:nickel pincer cofactor biosynthesis protein LarB n=1 Tax=Anaerosolibacter sp. TaxID=1872527 RepID=UPI002620CF48|nr:nickel pincer cofactor biosynthesis protein LarB [Anaerosolibacter sp.]MDF2547287.1 1-(5-phosphoribosyl)-5-amino-4-imidazole-carboxylate carboxylase [Anaerosolibacter sp.]
MKTFELRKLLEEVKSGQVEVEQAVDHLKELPYKDIGIAKIDYHRELRNGYPEVIYCEGKDVGHIQQIVGEMLKGNNNILATRASENVYKAIKEICPDAEYHPLARIITVKRKEVSAPDSYIAVVTGGTSDIAVAEEAAITAEMLGNRVERIYDVGVAGLHRLLGNLDRITHAKVVIAVAGMEGALASVVGGLVDKPVLAVPTSIGYGANFNGLSALLSMLNSCSSGVAVMNIDNGFGAGYMASMINKL